MRGTDASSGRTRVRGATRPSVAICPNWWHDHLQPIRSVQEVAAMAGISVNAVRTHESTALRKLRDAIAQLNLGRRLR